MNFTYKNGLIWLSLIVEYNGQEIKIDNCILDTGSATTAIDIDSIDFNYQKPSTIKRLKGIGGGTQEVISQEVDKIVLDNLHLAKIEIEFGDIQEDFGINGFIGTDILQYFDMTISFTMEEITLKKRQVSTGVDRILIREEKYE